MPRSEFLKLAARELGYNPPARCLDHAIEVGAIPSPARFGRLFSFDPEDHLQPFVTYMREKSYIGRRLAEALGS